MLVNPFHKLYPSSGATPKKGDTFVVCGMYTRSYFDKALRLKHSLESFGLPYGLYEIPSIHSSISRHGKVNSEFNKPTFITEMMGRYNLPILYMDVDCVIEDEPKLIWDLANQGYDFAIFNWFSKERNDAYIPINLPGYGANRFYGYSHEVDFYDENQLNCSGAVQFWGNNKRVVGLINRWNKVIEENPNVPDDQSLDFAYNNFDKSAIRSHWLPKSYVRCAYWIFDKPIINHPDFPDMDNRQFQELKLKEGEHRFDKSTLQKKSEFVYIHPRLLLDKHKNQIVSYQNGIFLKISDNSLPIYL